MDLSTSPRPVVVGLSGGLGNQMFQYAAGRALSHRLGCPLMLDLTWFQNRQDRQFALDPFKIDVDTRSVFRFMPTSLQTHLSRITRRFSPRLAGVPVFRERHFQYMSSFAELGAPVFLEGYWQSERYFRALRSELLEEFSLRRPLPARLHQLLEAIQTCDSVCVHVRRGDYVTNVNAAKTHGTCSDIYYSRAVAEIANGLSNPHCFIFSDEPDYVRDTLRLDCSSTVVDVNGTEEAHLDLVLMSACRHFVIANSSFSWWGAWLGRCESKRVIAPARWFLTSDRNTEDLLPDSWQRLDG